MHKLVQGVHQFRENVFGNHKAFFQRLAHGQSPSALFITCSDSRLNPNLLTQTDPGELFILRNAGNIVPNYSEGSGEAATIEFAVSNLGVRDVIVCGHTNCGAIQGLMEPERTANMPAVTCWLHHAAATKKIVDENYADEPMEVRIKAAVQENVLVQLDQLRTHPCIAEKIEIGQLRLHGWVYKLGTAEVFYYSQETGQFEPMAPNLNRGPAIQRQSQLTTLSSLRR